LSTFDTVAGETPASCATSSIVVIGVPLQSKGIFRMVQACERKTFLLRPYVVHGVVYATKKPELSFALSISKQYKRMLAHKAQR
jgi:hypothetical protein